MFLCKMTSDSGTRKFILNTPSHGLEFFVPVWSSERNNFQSRHVKRLQWFNGLSEKGWPCKAKIKIR